MTVAVYLSGVALLAGSLWSAAKLAKNHEADATENNRSITQRLAEPAAKQNLYARSSEFQKLQMFEWPFSFGHRATAQVFAALQFLSTLARLWQRPSEYTADVLSIEKMQRLLQSNAGFQSYATLAISFLALEVGDFEKAIKLAVTQRENSAPNSIDYFQTSMILAFIAHYFSHDFHQAGQIYLELADQNPKLTWLKSLGLKLISMPDQEKANATSQKKLQELELPLGVLTSLCEILLRQNHGSRNAQFIGPCKDQEKALSTKELQENSK